MIPKIIHYCWFGGNPLPELAHKCIASWRRYFPDYAIKEWNENNYNVHKISYIDEAYNAKKYAFVSDYARFDILYKYGGIYFDVDVEVIKPFDNIVKNGCFMGFESVGVVAAGLGIGCNAGLGILYQILEFYSTLHFFNSDGSFNLRTVVEYVTSILKKNGLEMENTIQSFEGLTIYPSDYFCPKSYETGKLSITENTCSIHHYDSSWLSEKEHQITKKKQKIYAFFGVTIFSKIIIIFLYVLKRIKEHGIINAFKYYYSKYGKS